MKTGEKRPCWQTLDTRYTRQRAASIARPASHHVRICIIQSCYIPWKGFFDLIDRCDEYVIYDSAQYVKRHWHNRNRIKTANGVEWLTIPVVTKGRFEQPIDQVEIEKPWADKHWRALELAYKRAPFFEPLAPTVKEWYERADKEARLTDINAIFLRGIAGLLGLTTRIDQGRDLPVAGRQDRTAVGNCPRGRRRLLSERPLGARLLR